MSAVRRASALLVTMCTMAAAAPAHAQSEPTARRVYLLCNMEDPSCTSLIQKAYNDFLANPTWVVCLADGQPGCHRMTYTCKFVREPAITLQDIYVRYMEMVDEHSYLWNETARIAMYQTMNFLGRCTGKWEVLNYGPRYQI